jgi:hypothetical protein
MEVIMLKLMVFLMVVVSSFFFVSFSHAEFITCTADPEVALYRVRFSSDDGQTWGDWIESLPVNNALKHETTNMVRGVYKGEAAAGGYVELTDRTSKEVTTVFRWSDPAGFQLRVLPGKLPDKLKMKK